MITIIDFKAEDKISGIYCIYNKFTGKLYIGSTKNIKVRSRTHKKDLLEGRHHSKLLQRAYNKYGEAAFEYMVLEIIEPAKLWEREQYWLDLNESSNPKFGYNISGVAGSTSGIKYSTQVRAKMSEAMTPERKAHLSKVITGKVLGPRPEHVKAKIKATLTGQKLSLERRAKISKTRTGIKLTDETKAKLKKIWADRKAKNLDDAFKNVRIN